MGSRVWGGGVGSGVGGENLSLSHKLFVFFFNFLGSGCGCGAEEVGNLFGRSSYRQVAIENFGAACCFFRRRFFVE